MTTKTLRNRIAFVITILVNVITVISVVFLMQYVQSLLNKDLEINLQEIVLQNKVVINTKLQSELNDVTLSAKLIAKNFESAMPDENGGYANAEYLSALANFCADEREKDMFVANMDGIGIFEDGSTVDIPLRDYYTTAMKGESNIAKIRSRKEGDNEKEVFIMSVPLYLRTEVDGMFRSEIKGTVQRFFTVEEMYRICELSLFSSKGFMHIINAQGDIIVQSENFSFNEGTDNFYRILNSHENASACAQLERDIAIERENTMRVFFGGAEFYCSYTPINGLYQWYLISSVSVDDIAANSNTVVKLFYGILLSIVIIFGISVILFFFYKNRQQKARDRVTFVDAVTKGYSYAKFLLDFKTLLPDRLEETPASLLSFDIDNFKYINSYYGFEYGDSILRQIYDHIRANLTQDEMIARISGDHFVVLLRDDGEERVKALLNVSFQERKLIFFSAGVYRIKDASESVPLMMDKANTAARSVKAQFCNKISYFSEDYDNLLRRNEQLKRELDVALIRGEIRPFYQPKVDVNTGRLVGAEALARWITPEGKMIFPAEFISLCEKTGQIIDVDLAIFRQVLAFLAKNLAIYGDCVPISVNFSRVHLKNPDFIHKIVETMKEFGVDGKYVEIELTESIVFDDQSAMVELVRHLHKHGLVVCIDDFGSGYSSLNMLKDIPVDVLKIDKGFLDATTNADRQRQILSVIAEMAQKLNMSVVVEGVETAENVELMKTIGYSVAQGYFFAKPMSEEKFDGLLKDGAISPVKAQL